MLRALPVSSTNPYPFRGSRVLRAYLTPVTSINPYGHGDASGPG